MGAEGSKMAVDVPCTRVGDAAAFAPCAREAAGLVALDAGAALLFGGGCEGCGGHTQTHTHTPFTRSYQIFLCITHRTAA